MLRSLARLAWLLVACPAAIPALAADEPAAADVRPDSIDWSEWTPALTLGIALFNQDTVATTHGIWHSQIQTPTPESSFRNDCDNNPNNGTSQCRWIAELGDGNEFQTQTASGTTLKTLEFGRFFYKHDHLDGAAIPLSLELLGPGIPGLPGRPRPLVEAAYQWPREPRLLVARANSGIQSQAANPVPPTMELYVRMERMWWAGFGGAFDLELNGFPLQIRPSLNYFGQQAEIHMTSSYPIPVTNGAPVDTTETLSETYHGFGPKLGINIEMGRRGPLAFNLLLSTYLAWFPGDSRTVRRGIVKGPPPGVGGTDPFTPDPIGNETYDFRFDNLQEGGSIAFRVSWVGYSE